MKKILLKASLLSFIILVLTFCTSNSDELNKTCISKSSSEQSSSSTTDSDPELPCYGKPKKNVDCPDVMDPVLGCDGKVYSNACYAAKAGILRYTKVGNL